MGTGGTSGHLSLECFTRYMFSDSSALFYPDDETPPVPASGGDGIAPLVP